MKNSDLTKRIDEFETKLRAGNGSRRSKADEDIVQYIIQVASFPYEFPRKVDKVEGSNHQ